MTQGVEVNNFNLFSSLVKTFHNMGRTKAQINKLSADDRRDYIADGDHGADDHDWSKVYQQRDDLINPMMAWDFWLALTLAETAGAGVLIPSDCLTDQHLARYAMACKILRFVGHNVIAAEIEYLIHTSQIVAAFPDRASGEYYN